MAEVRLLEFPVLNETCNDWPMSVGWNSRHKSKVLQFRFQVPRPTRHRVETSLDQLNTVKGLQMNHKARAVRLCVGSNGFNVGPLLHADTVDIEARHRCQGVFA